MAEVERELAERVSKKRKIITVVTALELLDSSSDEEDIIPFLCAAVMSVRKSRRRKRHRQHNYYDSVILSFRLDEFKTFFRISRVSAQYMLEYIGRVCEEENIVGITDRAGSGGEMQKPLEQRLLAMLWFLASQDKYASIADRFGWSESTACVAIHKLLIFVSENLLAKLIVWPSEAAQLECSEHYHEAKHFPGVIGMLDGTHIQIRKPQERGIDYYNRKDYYSVILQGVVNEKMEFIDVHTGWPGKVHDARVFRNSPLSQTGSVRCGERHILGDSAYPILNWVLTPYRDNGHLTRAQRRYNTTQASIRSVVERAFGLLKGRFVRLRYIHQKELITIVSTVLASCVLHNVCIKNGVDFADALQEDGVPNDYPNGENFDARAQQRGSEKRDLIAENLM